MSVYWDHRNQTDCKVLAEDKAGPSENGYLYRLYWNRDKECIRLIAYPILKITPRCFKIHPKVLAKPIYVSKGKQRYAHETLKDAIYSYTLRRQAMVHRMEYRLRDAERSLLAITPDDPMRIAFWCQDEDKPPEDELAWRADEELI